MNDPASKAVMAVSFFGMIAITIRSVANAWAKRFDSDRSPSNNAIEGRLDRIESAVDVIAIEVERIAEAQRFAIRLASEKDTGRIPAPSNRSGGGRTVTPH